MLLKTGANAIKAEHACDDMLKTSCQNEILFLKKQQNIITQGIILQSQIYFQVSLIYTSLL